MPKEVFVQLLIHKIPTRIKKNFKAACARKNVSMHDAIIAMMRDFARKEDNDPINTNEEFYL